MKAGAAGAFPVVTIEPIRADGEGAWILSVQVGEWSMIEARAFQLLSHAYEHANELEEAFRKTGAHVNVVIRR
jgi:hypothetical protein